MPAEYEAGGSGFRLAIGSLEVSICLYPSGNAEVWLPTAICKKIRTSKIWFRK